MRHCGSLEKVPDPFEEINTTYTYRAEGSHRVLFIPSSRPKYLLSPVILMVIVFILRPPDLHIMLTLGRTNSLLASTVVQGPGGGDGTPPWSFRYFAIF